VVVVKDEGSEDDWVEVCVGIFLEQNKVCDSFEGGEKEINNFFLCVLTFQFGNFADGCFHGSNPGSRGSFDFCSKRLKIL